MHFILKHYSYIYIYTWLIKSNSILPSMDYIEEKLLQIVLKHIHE